MVDEIQTYFKHDIPGGRRPRAVLALRHVPATGLQAADVSRPAAAAPSIVCPPVMLPTSALHWDACPASPLLALADDSLSQGCSPASAQLGLAFCTAWQRHACSAGRALLC